MKWCKRIVVYATWWLASLMIYDTLFPAVSTLMAARVVTLRSVEREWVPLSAISPNLVRAVIAAEDGKFCTHHGVDWNAMKGAVGAVVDPDARVTHGGSTITMQTAKNLFLWHGFSYVRKPLEVPIALVVDALWRKRRIMENYLNVAEFGRGIFGAQAAARHYFGKSAAWLTPREAALLAATLPAPTRRNPANPDGVMEAYANNIAARVSRGVLSSCAR